MAPTATTGVSRTRTPPDLRVSIPNRRVFVGTDPEGYAGCCEAIAAMDLRPLLSSITAPTQVIAGAEDPATPPWHGAVIASGIRNSRLRIIRGAAHLANISQPGEFTAALLAHLAAR